MLTDIRVALYGRRLHLQFVVVNLQIGIALGKRPAREIGTGIGLCEDLKRHIRVQQRGIEIHIAVSVITTGHRLIVSVCRVGRIVVLGNHKDFTASRGGSSRLGRQSSPETQTLRLIRRIGRVSNMNSMHSLYSGQKAHKEYCQLQKILIHHIVQFIIVVGLSVRCAHTSCVGAARKAAQRYNFFLIYTRKMPIFSKIRKNWQLNITKKET